jgi:glutamate-5-semialdehyde dehydrogenase
MLKAKRASSRAAASSEAVRNEFLNNLARQVQLRMPEIMEANDRDMEEGRKNGLGEAILDRLILTGVRIFSLVRGLADCAALPDPLGEIESLKLLRNGLQVGRRRTSLGLIGFICEARPGAVVEAAAMAVKSGNALIAKPGRDSTFTSQALGLIIERALTESSLSPDTVVVNPAFSREELVFMLEQSDLLNLVIPRGGESLIRFVEEHSRVPVLRHYKGVNHLFVDKGADLDMALALTENGKCDRPSTCNALECLLVHEAAATAFIPKMAEALQANGVTLLGDPESAALSPLIDLAQEGDYGREFLDLVMAVKVVRGLDDALEHIEKYGSNHTEAICTRSLQSAQKFLSLVDASCVLVNASTRLNDGGCLGLGAEIGISTSKLHAYGPMGLKELTTTKFVVIGDGHIR